MEQPNLNYITDMSGGDKEFEAKIIAVLKKELPEEFEEFKNQIEKKNFEESAALVHKIKHKISILGLKKAFEAAAKFESELKNDQDDSGYQSFENVIKFMMDFLSPL